MPRLSEDWSAVLLGRGPLAIIFAAVLMSRDSPHPLESFLTSPSGW